MLTNMTKSKNVRFQLLVRNNSRDLKTVICFGVSMRATRRKEQKLFNQFLGLNIIVIVVIVVVLFCCCHYVCDEFRLRMKQTNQKFKIKKKLFQC